MNLLFRLNPEWSFESFELAKEYFDNLEEENGGCFHAKKQWHQIEEKEIVYFLWNKNIVAKAKKGHYNYDKENIDFPCAYKLYELKVFDEGHKINTKSLSKMGRDMTYLTAEDTAYLETLC